ncbi:MAG: hypothetical protein Kow0069_29770 [Promethearchaeota archaeon]
MSPLRERLDGMVTEMEVIKTFTTTTTWTIRMPDGKLIALSASISSGSDPSYLVEVRDASSSVALEMTKDQFDQLVGIVEQFAGEVNLAAGSESDEHEVAPPAAGPPDEPAPPDDRPFGNW